MKRMLKTNPHLKKLIQDLRKLGAKSELWKKAAKCLSYPTRKRIEVNLTKLSNQTKPNDTVLVPGKVLNGELKHKLTVSAFQISQSAKNKVNFITIQELIKKDPKGVKLVC